MRLVVTTSDKKAQIWMAKTGELKLTRLREVVEAVEEPEGDDEQDPAKGLIGWSAPIARALRGARVGDLRKVHLPGGEKEWEVLAISYPEG